MKRTWKRWGALLLAVVMTLSLLPTAAFAAEGDTPTNLAQEKNVYVSGLEVEDEATNAAKAVDGNSDTRWSGNKMHKADGATNGSNPSWIVVDLTGADECVASITSISMAYHNLVWSTDYVVQVAGNDYTPVDFSSNLGVVAASNAAFSGQHAKDAACWTTIKTYENHTNEAYPTDTVTEFEQPIPAGTRYLRLYFTKINTNAAGASIGLKELTVMGTTQPTVTQYVRHSGAIEEGTYIIYDPTGNRVLHNSGTATNQCEPKTSGGNNIIINGNKVTQLGHASDSFVPEDHLWKIVGNETDGYTIQGVTAARPNYLTATASGSQLSLSGESSAAVKVTFSPSGDNYKVSPATESSKSLRYSGGWQFSETANTVQLFKATVIPVTIASAGDGSRDVGAESGTYSNSIIHAWASSQHASGSDGPATWATDGNTTSIWHTRYNNEGGDDVPDAENTNSETTSTAGWNHTSLPASVERRWIELDIVAGKANDLPTGDGEAQWLSGLRYMGRTNTNGGSVMSCEIRVWSNGSWVPVTSSTDWTMGTGNSGDWCYKEFDYPVLTNKVRLYGVTTDNSNSYMIAKEIRLVKALTTPTTASVTVAVKDQGGNALEGATVTAGGQAATTNTSGEATVTNLIQGQTYTATATKDGYTTGKATVTAGETTTAEITLRQRQADIEANVATYDYPLTNDMVSAVSFRTPAANPADGHVYWAIDYDDSHWWHQEYDASQDVWFQFSLPTEVAIAGIRYQKRLDGSGSLGSYEIQTSEDGTTWTTLEDETGTWPEDNNIHAHTFAFAETAKYFRVHRTGGNASNRTAKLFQLVLAPEGRTTVSGTVTKDSTPVEGATVTVYQGDTATYKKVTTGSDGTYSLVLPKDGRNDWKLVATAPGCSPAEYTLTTNEGTASHDFALAARELHVTGTAPEGTAVQLMQGAGRTPVADIEAQTGTSFDFNVSTLEAGTYYVRAWKDGYVPAWKEVTWTATTTSLDAVTVAESDLVAVDTSSAYKNYDFSDAAQVSEFVSLYGAASGTAAHDSENGAMTLTFSGNGNSNMWANAVGSKDYVLKNGTISFDVTQTAGDVNGRFGLVFLQFNGDGEEAWAYIGQMDIASRYFAENAKVGGGDSGYSNGSDGAAMGVGVKRHFEVTVNGANLALKIDGLNVMNWNSNAATAGYWGFTQNKQNTTYRIDNLVVTRADAKNTVSWSAGEGETLTAAIVTPDNTTGTALTSGGNAFAGDTIKIIGTKTGAILNAVTVNGSAEGVTKTAVEGGGYTYTFTMPAEAATVVGTFVDLIPNFTVSGADESGSISAGTVGESGFTGNTLTIEGEMASDGAATFQWYKKTGDGEWAEISGADSSSYTIKQGDYNSTTTTKLKVTVTGDGSHHAGWKESDEFTVAPPVYAVTGVDLERDTLTMWTNHTPTASGEYPTEVGSSATMTATVVPENVTGAEITWSSSNESAVTVEKSATDAKTATLTAVGNGTATITVSVAAGGVTKTATCEVTVKTKVASITVKNGETPVTEQAPVKVYLNDNDDTAPRTVTVKGTVEPTSASDKVLVWTRTGGTTGKINIQPATGSDENPDSATSSGSGVRISAVGTDSKNVGEVTVKVAAHDGMGAETTFKVQVWRKLAHEVTIGGTPKYGETLEVNTDSLDMTAAGKAALTYQWKRGDENISGATSKTYELVEDDIGQIISVVVTAGANTYYEGSKTASTATAVAQADAPATPTLSPTKPSAAGATDGYITITNYVSTQTYQIKAGDAGSWEDAEVTNEGKIENLGAGKYSVKVKETTTQKESAAATATIAEGDAVEYTITATQPTTGATISVTDKATKDDEVTITLTVTAGWQVDAVKVNEGAVTVTEGEDNTWTFTMPEEDVTVTAEVSRIQVTITLALTNITAICDADGEHTGNDTHTVEYGEVAVITLEADEGYALPESITVAYTDPDDTATAPGTRWNYDSDTGKITFTYGTQKDITITAVAAKKEYTVSLTATGGHLDLSGDEDTVEHDETFTGTLSVNDSAYELPETITIVMGETTLVADTDYTYNASTGAISIPNVIGDIEITATAVEKKTQLTGVTISILHNDSTGMGSSNQNVPHVGDTLTATAAPTGATVSYQWFVGDSTTAAGSAPTYVVKDGDMGETIKVVVTGTGKFEGTKEATTVAVGEKTWRVTGVSLNKTSTSIEFGGEETLTATIEPSTATNKKVSWTSSNTNVATVDANGKVTAVGVGSATITVTTEDGEQTATCTVTVEKKALPELHITTPQVGKAVTVSFTGGVSADVATYEWYTGEGTDPDATGAWTRQTGASDATWTVDSENVRSGMYIMVIAYAKNTSNYKGSSVVVSAAILGNDYEKTTYPVTVTKTGEGTVTVKVNNEEASEAAENDMVRVEVTGVAENATVEVATAVEGVTLTKGTGNTWTFTMPAEAVEITVTITGGTVTPPTVDTTELETAIAAAKEAKEGVETIDGKAEDEVAEGTKFVTTADVEALDAAIAAAEAAKDAAETAEDVAAAVEALNAAVTAFEEAIQTGTKPGVDTTALEVAITAAENAKKNVVVGENAEEVPSNKKFVSEEEMQALNDAIDAAKEALDAADKTAESVADAVEALNTAVEAFKDACQQGTKKVSTPVVVVPSTTTETKENEDGSVTTTVTAPDGTVTETTEKPDGTKETVETKPDGTVVETTEKPDGTVSEVVTEPDGTVTETTTQPDGAKVEKITDPEEGVTVTATDAEGEVVAEVKVPAVIPESETRFVDVPEGHWADEAIHKIAAMALVEGVGDNKYDMESGVTRGALATILHRMSNKPAGSEVSFQDVLDDKYYTEGVAWAAKVGVVEGFSANTFKPEQTITREQLALMLMRYAKLLGMDVTADAEVLNVYDDGNTTHAWAVDGVAWCVQNGIILGKSEEILAPTDYVTRAQVAVMLDRFIALMK